MTTKLQKDRTKFTERTIAIIWASSGGLCYICHEYLLENSTTKRRVKHGQIAHIVAAEKNGPRGNDPLPIKDRNKPSNLMLLCGMCHKEIDDIRTAGSYSKTRLLKIKDEHESKIKALMTAQPDTNAQVLRFLGTIRGNTPTVSDEEIRSAIFKHEVKYPPVSGSDLLDISLNTSDSNYIEYLKSSSSEINSTFQEVIRPRIKRGDIKSLSVFALARIPLLFQLGFSLDDKIPITLYKKNRVGSEDWNWHKKTRVRFNTKVIQQGNSGTPVSILLSCSGEIKEEELPAETQNNTIYSISPVKKPFGRNLLDTYETLNEFRAVFAHLLRRIESDNAPLVNIFPAIPAPFAIICGREFLKGKSPDFKVFDLDSNGNYIPTINLIKNGEFSYENK